VIVDRYDARRLHSDPGFAMGEIDPAALLRTGAAGAWGRVAPGAATTAHQHDESEVFVIVTGTGEVVSGPDRADVGPGSVVLFEPFESHLLTNTGDEDLTFVTFYWRAPEVTAAAAARPARRLGERPTFVFSTPPTPNGDLHLGHLSGPYLGADVFVRFQRMLGRQAWHLTGSDDYQSYVVAAGTRDGRTPAQTAAHFSAEIAATLALMDIPLDQYTVTDTEPGYPDGVREFIRRAVEAGPITARPGPALMDSVTGDYLYEVDVSGGCPSCDAPAGGNICEECGEPNRCVDLVNPRSARSPQAPAERDVVRLSLPLHDFAPVVAEHHRISRVPARLRELARRVFDRPEFDIPITHPADWGVRPPHPEVADQVVWVWPEMSYGFLHGIEALGRRLGHDWRALSPDPDWKVVHFFGYDNSFYHTILYPVLYRLAFPEWKPDIDYHVNEFYLLDGDKFSTSRRHAVWGKEILSTSTVDAVRYHLCRTRPEGRRTNFSRDGYERTLHETLIGQWQSWLHDLGARVTARYGGLAPDAGVWTAEHTGFLRTLQLRADGIAAALGPDDFSLNRAAEQVGGLVTDVRRFRQREAPLDGLAGCADESRTAVALELAAAHLLAVGTAPLMPRFSGRLAAALGVAAPHRWPEAVALVPSGSKVTLTDQVFFGGEPAGPETLALVTDIVREVLRLPADTDPAGRTLAQLGAGSLQTVALQMRILERTSVSLPIEELIGATDVADLAVRVDRCRRESSDAQ
jgi:methionyl-tRNA synthetase